jgi:hypothetical protein
MKNKNTPDARTEHKWEAHEVIVRPPRMAARIEDGDWKRWIRLISKIPERESIYRNVAFACFGVAIPSLLSSIVALPPVSGLPGFISTLYFGVGIVALGSGLLCLSFDKKLGRVSGQRVEEVLQDMKEVRERSVRSEETIKAEVQASTIG